jgi:hypothetical protein
VPDSLNGLNVDTMRSGFDSRMSKFVNWGMQGTTEILIGSSTDVDAISRIKRVGDWMTVLSSMTLAADTALKTAITGLRAAAGMVGSVKLAGTGVDLSPVGTAIWDWALSVVVPQLAKMMSWLDILAFYFGTFLPSLPYGIFMIVVVGWVLAVIQSVVAAPLWMVMHMRPSQTFIGSDQQGYLLLLSLFVRPALAVLGLFAGILAADPIVDYLAKAFFSMRTAIVTSQESLGWIVEFMTFTNWMVVFGFILLPITYMVFGLPQVLPDHVLKWIGAGVGDLGETDAGRAMRGNMERAALASAGAPPVALPRRGGGGAPGGSDPLLALVCPQVVAAEADNAVSAAKRRSTLVGKALPLQRLTWAHPWHQSLPAAEKPASTSQSGNPSLSSGTQGVAALDERPAASGTALSKAPASTDKPINTGDTTPPQGEPA